MWLFHFRLHVNDKRYHVKPPPRSKASMEELEKFNDVRLLVAQVICHLPNKLFKKTLNHYTHG